MFLIFRETIQGGLESLPLEAEEIRHLRARRLQAGDALRLGDGRHRRWSGILGPAGDSFCFQIGLEAEIVYEPEMILCTAMPSGKRWDWLLQKATELGATSICPTIFERSERFEMGSNRMKKIIREAASQSQRYTLPQLSAPQRLEKLSTSFSGKTFVFCSEGKSMMDQFSEGIKTVLHQSPLMAIIGPEGGFTRAERELFSRMGWTLCSLGPHVLRVETAALAALTFFQLLSGTKDAPIKIR